MTKYAIIVAGGLGQRFESEIPKQFILLYNLPILMHTINVFYNYDNNLNIIVVLPENQTDQWKILCEEYKYEIKHKVVIGGETRFDSVKNGICEVTEESLVSIHDGVRPLVSNETINKCFETALLLGNAIPVIEPVDSIREIGFNENFSLKRDNLRLVQTPQVFKGSSLKIAYQQTYRRSFTDDSVVIESIGEKINLVQGNIENIKITTNHDLTIAKVLFKKQRR